VRLWKKPKAVGGKAKIKVNIRIKGKTRLLDRTDRSINNSNINPQTLNWVRFQGGWKFPGSLKPKPLQIIKFPPGLVKYVDYNVITIH